MNQEDKSKIDDMNRSLYSRGSPDIRTKRKLRFSSENTDINTDWEHPKEVLENIELNTKYKDSSMSFFTKLLVISIIIFLISLGIGLFLLFNGSNIVSANNIDIKINGPVSVAGGEPVSFDIKVLNKNNIKLETVDMSVDFPAGTVNSQDTTKELRNIRELIPDINAGGEGEKTIKAVLYGEENTKKEILITVEYRVKGSNAVFQKQKSFDILIGSSPLSLKIDSYKEVNSGQEFEISATINSNSKETIKNILLNASYPFGFTYTSSDQKPFNNNNVWKIGDMPANAKKTIKIKGKLDGQDDESRVFRFNIGAQSIRNDKVIGTEYISGIQEISIKKPFIGINVSIDGDSESQEYIGSFDNPSKIDINYFNNLPVSIINGEIKVKLSGNAFDKVSVSPDLGLYLSESNEIVWNSITNSELKNIGAGESGRVSFSLIPRNASNPSKQVINPHVSLSVNVLGKRLSENDVPESIVSSINRKIKISSDISLGGQIVRSVGPFTNTGPIPPKAEQETTYTVIWTIDNTANPVSGVEVRSSLPSYVKWLGKISPSNENISYNSVDGQIVWNVGNVPTYTTRDSKRRQIAFQISLNPSIVQIGQIPILINEATLNSQDDFTNQTLSSNLSSLTTRFSTDPAYKDKDETISK